MRTRKCWNKNESDEHASPAALLRGELEEELSFCEAFCEREISQQIAGGEDSEILRETQARSFFGGKRAKKRL